MFHVTCSSGFHLMLVIASLLFTIMRQRTDTVNCAYLCMSSLFGSFRRQNQLGYTCLGVNACAACHSG